MRSTPSQLITEAITERNWVRVRDLADRYREVFLTEFPIIARTFRVVDQILYDVAREEYTDKKRLDAIRIACGLPENCENQFTKSTTALFEAVDSNDEQQVASTIAMHFRHYECWHSRKKDGELILAYALRRDKRQAMNELYARLPMTSIAPAFGEESSSQLFEACKIQDTARLNKIATEHPEQFIWASFLPDHQTGLPLVTQNGNQALRDLVFATLVEKYDEANVLKLRHTMDERLLKLTRFECAMLCQQEDYVRKHAADHIQELRGYANLYQAFGITLEIPAFIVELTPPPHDPRTFGTVQITGSGGTPSATASFN